MPLAAGVLPESDGSKAHSWTPVEAQSFIVREGPNYAKNKKKSASAAALFEIFAVDAYRSEKKVPHFAQYVDIPRDPDADKLGIPAVLIINLMVPSYGPSLLGGGVTDGPGWCAVFYAKLTDAARQLLLENKPSPSLSLLRNFMHAPGDSPLTKRFKCIARAENIDDCGFSSVTRSMVKKYNATPFLARTTSSFYLTPNYFEVDIDVHGFGKPARMGLAGCQSVVQQIVFDWAFVVEGVEDDELPEQILLAVRLNKIDPTNVAAFEQIIGGQGASAPPRQGEEEE